MKEIVINGETAKVRANPLALLFYKQEFKSDLIGDISKMQGLEQEPGKFDSVMMLQLVWALLKAGSDNPFGYPPFQNWIERLEHFDFNDTVMLAAIMEEAMDGFFRRRPENRGVRK